MYDLRFYPSFELWSTERPRRNTARLVKIIYRYLHAKLFNKTYLWAAVPVAGWISYRVRMKILYSLGLHLLRQTYRGRSYIQWTRLEWRGRSRSRESRKTRASRGRRWESGTVRPSSGSWKVWGLSRSTESKVRFHTQSFADYFNAHILVRIVTVLGCTNIELLGSGGQWNIDRHRGNAYLTSLLSVSVRRFRRVTRWKSR